VQESWATLFSSLSEKEKAKFSSYACNSLDDYLEKLKEACQREGERSYFLKVLEWFEPMFKTVELVLPAVSVGIQAYPNPGSLVLGGIVGVLDITRRLLRYQSLSLQMLAEMGRKVKILLEYERDVYKDDAQVQKTTLKAYGAIIAFCSKAFRFLTSEDGHLRARVKGFSLMIIKDFESQLGKEVQNFETHMEELEDRVRLCDRRRLMELHDNQEAYAKIGKTISAGLQRQGEILERLWKNQQDKDERSYSRSKFSGPFTNFFSRRESAEEKEGRKEVS
jgi:hypothetical protein